MRKEGQVGGGKAVGQCKRVGKASVKGQAGTGVCKNKIEAVKEERDKAGGMAGKREGSPVRPLMSVSGMFLGRE